MVTANDVWRDYNTSGVPSTLFHKPVLAEIRAWGTYLESLASLAFSNGKIYALKSALNADLVPAANTPAIVSGDPTPGNDGLYMKVGATGTGSWTQLLPFVPGTQFVTATDTGAGTPDAIQTITTLPVSPSGGQLITTNIFEPNAGTAPTISFNGGTPLTIKKQRGGDFLAGELPAFLLGFISGGVFQSIFDLPNEATLAAISAAAVAAQVAAVTATSAAAASLYGKGIFPTTAAGIGYGVVSNTAITGGSGGANGTFDLAFTGGTGSGAAGRFVVAGGALTQIVLTAPGSYTVVPAFSFAASSGLTGAASTPILGRNADVGEYFWAPLSTSELARYVVEAGPVATDTGDRSPIGAVTGGLSYGAVDASDNRIFNFTADKIDHYHMRIVDARSKKAEGRSTLVFGRTPRSDRIAALLSTLSHLIVWGQSLGVGFVNFSDRRSFLQKVLMPNGGPDWRTTNASPSVSFNATQPLWRGGAGSVFKMVAQLLLDEDGIDFTTLAQQFLISNAGVGGASMANLNTTYYPRFEQDITVAKAIFDALGVGYGVGGVIMIHGEADAANNSTTYLADARAMRTKNEASVQTLAKTSAPLPWYIDQMCSHIGSGSTQGPKIGLDQLTLGDDANVCLVTPTYMFSYADYLHMNISRTGYEWMGAYFGHAIKRWAFDGVKTKALKPAQVVKIGSSIYLEYDLAFGRQLVFDTTLVPAQPNKGFDVVDGGGSPLTITSVGLAARDVVELKMAAEPTISTDRWRYGWRNVDAWAGGTTEPGSKGKGNLRDDNPLIFDPYGGGGGLTMYKWAAINEGGIT
jgi:hypothetical protein